MRRKLVVRRRKEAGPEYWIPETGSLIGIRRRGGKFDKVSLSNFIENKVRGVKPDFLPPSLSFSAYEN